MILIWAGCLAPATGFVNLDASPKQTIVEITERFVSALQENRLAIKENPQVGFALADRLVLPHLDFHRFSRWVLGKHWRIATPEQRDRFVKEFRESLIRTYVTAMISFVDEIISLSRSITYPPHRFRGGKKRAIVPMRIELTSGGEAEIKYRMYIADGTWKIYDVTVQGISLATTYRQAYSSMIHERGLDRLLMEMEERNNSSVNGP